MAPAPGLSPPDPGNRRGPEPGSVPMESARGAIRGFGGRGASVPVPFGSVFPRQRRRRRTGAPTRRRRHAPPAGFFPAALLFLTGVGALSGCGAGEERPARPNIVVIVADDLGYTDLGAFGGDIRTPNLDALAARGVRFTDFHTAATCSPTRAMLLSGVDHHRAGLGGMASLMGEDLEGRIGYEGFLNDHVFHLPAVLREAGYFTAIAGKWHLGQADDQSPRSRGFDRSFVLLTGAASHFEDAAPVDDFDEIRYRRDGEILDGLPPGFYSTRAYTDRLLENLDEAESLGKPFFLLGTYTAPHWPLQVPDEFLDLYAGAYDEGWEALARQRVAGAKRAGVIPAETAVPPLPRYARRFADLPAGERRRETRTMEIYAAMVDRLDHHLGRLVTALEERGHLENTLFVFFSDNGAAGEAVTGLPGNDTFLAEHFDFSYEEIGRRGSFAWLSPEWAHAITAPYRYFKQFNHEGGIRVPGFAAAPASLTGLRPGSVESAFVQVTDLFPTFLELAGAQLPDADESDRRARPTGVSLLPLLAAADDAARPEAEAGWELFGRRAYRRGKWKIVWQPPPLGAGAWALHDLEADPGELRDLADETPEVLDSLLSGWARYVAENGVIVVEQDRAFGQPTLRR